MPFLPFAVRSTLRQTMGDFELILLDDGSTDSSLEYARSLEDPRVRVISDGLNLKLNIRLNQIVDLAKGEFFCRMDADDIMMPKRLERQIEICRRKTNEKYVIGSKAITIDSKNNIIGIRKVRKSIKNSYQARTAFIHPTVLAKTNWFRENRYNEEFVFHRSQDAELWLRTWKTTEFVILEEPLLFYRENDKINVENYVGTGLGLVIMGIRNEKYGIEKKMAWVLLELIKIWVVVSLSLYKNTGALINRRSNKLTKTEKELYAKLLQQSIAP